MQAFKYTLNVPALVAEVKHSLNITDQSPEMPHNYCQYTQHLKY